MAPKPEKVADAATLVASLKAKNGPLGEPPPAGTFSPVTQESNDHTKARDAVVMVRLMRNNPGRAFEDVEKMARESNLLGHDPIMQAMEQHPGLTREKADEMAKDFGF